MLLSFSQFSSLKHFCQRFKLFYFLRHDFGIKENFYVTAFNQRFQFYCGWFLDKFSQNLYQIPQKFFKSVIPTEVSKIFYLIICINYLMRQGQKWLVKDANLENFKHKNPFSHMKISVFMKNIIHVIIALQSRGSQNCLRLMSRLGLHFKTVYCSKNCRSQKFFYLLNI